MNEIIVGLISTIVGLWLGSIEMRLKNLDARLREAPSRSEVEKTISNKIEPVKVLQAEIKEDVKYMRARLDHFINNQDK